MVSKKPLSCFVFYIISRVMNNFEYMFLFGFSKGPPSFSRGPPFVFIYILYRGYTSKRIFVYFKRRAYIRPFILLLGYWSCYCYVCGRNPSFTFTFLQARRRSFAQQSSWCQEILVCFLHNSTWHEQFWICFLFPYRGYSLQRILIYFKRRARFGPLILLLGYFASIILFMLWVQEEATLRSYQARRRIG